MPKNFGDIFPKRFLQLPDLHPEIIQLANDVVGDAPSSSKKAERILKRLRNNYGYSLDLVNETGQTGLYEFLFRRREGHCEYFATAMVVLLRVNGIPSRMVNGFAGGEWNDLGNYLIVRQKHAHSWVEAYLPGQGWMVFDPTPPDPAPEFEIPEKMDRAGCHPAYEGKYLDTGYGRRHRPASVPDKTERMVAVRVSGQDSLFRHPLPANAQEMRPAWNQ